MTTECFLPITKVTCPTCSKAVDGMSFANDLGTPIRLRPCRHFIDREQARDMIGVSASA